MHADDKEVLLTEIFQDLNNTREYILKVLDEIKENDVSNYPILVLSKADIALGLKIVDKAEFDTKWNINISHLEEFVIKGVVQKDKAKDFIKVYKEHHRHFCLFVTLNEKEADFVYVKNTLV